MVVVLFYHLTRSTVEQTARTLLTRAVRRGWRVTVRSTKGARLDHLDRALWLGPEDEFLAHGRAGGPHDAFQPILLTDRDGIPNTAQAVLLLDGAPVDVARSTGLERVWVLFEETEPALRELARAQWKQVTEAGLPAQYWSEDSGRWEMQMDRAGPAGQV
jgi:DNA polymerase-3 subunit chi